MENDFTTTEPNYIFDGLGGSSLTKYRAVRLSEGARETAGQNSNLGTVPAGERLRPGALGREGTGMEQCFGSCSGITGVSGRGCGSHGPKDLAETVQAGL